MVGRNSENTNLGKIKEKGGTESSAIVLGRRNEPWQLRDTAVATNTHMQLKTADGCNVFMYIYLLCSIHTYNIVLKHYTYVCPNYTVARMFRVHS